MAETNYVAFKGMRPDRIREVLDRNVIAYFSEYPGVGPVIARRDLEMFLQLTGRGQVVETPSEYADISIVVLTERKVKGSAATDKGALQATENTARAHFIAYCLKQQIDLTPELEARVAQTRQAAETEQVRLLELLRAQQQAEEELKAYQENGAEALAARDYGEDFDTIANSPEVNSVGFDESSESLVIVTNTITHRHAGRLGIFKITINLNPRGIDFNHYGCNKVQIQYERMDGRHPTYNMGDYRNDFCLGNGSELIYKALKNSNLYLAFQHIMTYLKEG